MQINPDLIRKIVLFVEDNAAMSRYVGSLDLKEYLPNHNSETIAYHVRYLSQADILSKVSFYRSGEFNIIDLTPKGHEFAQSVRNDTTWNAIKSKASDIGAYSVDVLVQIAQGVITNLITKSLGG